MSVEKLKVEHIEEAQTFLQTEKNSDKSFEDKPHKDISCGFWIFKGELLQRYIYYMVHSIWIYSIVYLYLDQLCHREDIRFGLWHRWLCFNDESVLF